MMVSSAETSCSNQIFYFFEEKNCIETIFPSRSIELRSITRLPQFTPRRLTRSIRIIKLNTSLTPQTKNKYPILCRHTTKPSRSCQVVSLLLFRCSHKQHTPIQFRLNISSEQIQYTYTHSEETQQKKAHKKNAILQKSSS